MPGGKTAQVGRLQDPVHTTVAVSATSTAVLAESTTRQYVLLQNDSDTDMYVNLAGAAAELHKGVLLQAYGGSLELGPAYGNAVLGAITAIHGGSGTKALLVTVGQGV